MEDFRVVEEFVDRAARLRAEDSLDSRFSASENTRPAKCSAYSSGVHGVGLNRRLISGAIAFVSIGLPYTNSLRYSMMATIRQES